jgi:hypothetical protein
MPKHLAKKTVVGWKYFKQHVKKLQQPREKPKMPMKKHGRLRKNSKMHMKKCRLLKKSQYTY